MGRKNVDCRKQKREEPLTQDYKDVTSLHALIIEDSNKIPQAGW